HAEAVVREFWRLMATNDFHAVKAVLADDVLVDWPQSKERLRGPDHFARMNAEYPAHGRWTFRINRLVASGAEVVTQVSVSDGVHHAHRGAFCRVGGDPTGRRVESGPAPCAAPENRRHLTEPMP